MNGGDGCTEWKEVLADIKLCTENSYYNGKFMSCIFLLMPLNCISKTAKMRGLERWLGD